MDYKFKLNHQHKTSELSQGGESFEELLNKLGKITLENTLAETNSHEPVYPELDTNFVPQPAIYITEIDDRFYLLDYQLQYDPKPVPLEESNLLKPGQLSTTKESNNKIEVDSKALFFKNKGLLIGIGLGILLTLGATRIFSTTSSNQQAEPVAIDSATAPSQSVTLTEVTTERINRTLNASGTVTAFERTPVMSQAGGLLITEIFAERGDFVERAQVLAKLSDSILSAEKIEARGAVEQARARLDELEAGNRTEEIARAQSRVTNAKAGVTQAESNLSLVQKRVERNRTLQTEGAISRDRLDEVLNQEQGEKSDLVAAIASLNEAKQELAQLKSGSRPQTIAAARAELTQAQGRLQKIEAELANTIITAPSAGIIASRDAKVGQITSNSEQLFSIIQNGRLELRLQVPETLIYRIELGQNVSIASNADPSLQLTGKVREIDPLIDDSSRQATVKVDLPNNTNLKPGMFLQAAIDVDSSPGQAVAIEALLPQSGNKAIAFVLQSDNTVKAQTVEMGEILSQEKVEIIEGLNPGDRIALKGAAYLKDGDLVTFKDGL